MKSIGTIALGFIVGLSAAEGAKAQSSANNGSQDEQRATAPAPKLQLEPCRLPGWSEDVRCGKYEVYEDRQAKTGRKIALRVVMLPALSDKPVLDPVFYFAGGPGGSAVDTVIHAGKGYLSALRASRDLVFVDQRGSGASNPLVCDLYGDKNDMAAYFNERFPLDKVRACRAALEKVADLKLYSTTIAMDDLDEVRAALGYDKINLFGASYGSTAALAYLRQHPGAVRTAAVLGVVPPDAKIPLPVMRGVQNAVDRLFADCAADEKCRAAFPNLRADFDAALKLLDKEPASFEALNPFTKKPHRITLTRPAFGEFVRTMLYFPDSSQWLPLLMHQGAGGEFSIFASLAFQTFRTIEDSVLRGMNFSVVCAESVPFITDAEIARERAGSFYGDSRIQVTRQICDNWPRGSVPASFAAPVKSDVPVLLISGEADPVAPPWLGASAASHLSNSLHVTVPHAGHSFGFPCVDKLVADFVSSGSVKQLDASCLKEIRRAPFFTEEMVNAMVKVQTAKDHPSERAANEQIWQGVLDTGQGKLRLVLHISKAADGKYTGSVDSPDQGIDGLPIDAVVWKDGSLRFDVPMVAGVYEGKISGDASEISGQWSQQGHTLPLSFKLAQKGVK